MMLGTVRTFDAQQGVMTLRQSKTEFSLALFGWVAWVPTMSHWEKKLKHQPPTPVSQHHHLNRNPFLNLVAESEQTTPWTFAEASLQYPENGE